MQPNDLDGIARQIRLRDLQAVFEAGAGHIGGEMSAIDILTALYFRVMRIWPDQPEHPDRDRFVLSKGHVALALYVTLAKREAFGWAVTEINGNAMDEIVPALETRGSGPHCIVAHTNKGQGISFMQDRVDWHHKVPNAEQFAIAVAELSEAL